MHRVSDVLFEEPGRDMGCVLDGLVPPEVDIQNLLWSGCGCDFEAIYPLVIQLQLWYRFIDGPFSSMIF